MNDMGKKFNVGDNVVINTKSPDLLSMNGTLAEVTEELPASYNNDYIIKYTVDHRNVEIKVKESELQGLYDGLLSDLKVGQEAIYVPMDITVTVEQIDYLYEQVAIKFPDGGVKVVSSVKLMLKDTESDSVEDNYFEEKGLEIGQLVTNKQKAYGDSIAKTYKLMQVFLENYDNGDNTYTIPKELLQHILLQVRIIDKQNRIFSNPKGDLMSENGYADTVGYGLLGMRLLDEQQNIK